MITYILNMDVSSTFQLIIDIWPQIGRISCGQCDIFMHFLTCVYTEKDTSPVYTHDFRADDEMYRNDMFTAFSFLIKKCDMLPSLSAMKLSSAVFSIHNFALLRISVGSIIYVPNIMSKCELYDFLGKKVAKPIMSMIFSYVYGTSNRRRRILKRVLSELTRLDTVLLTMPSRPPITTAVVFDTYYEKYGEMLSVSENKILKGYTRRNNIIIPAKNIHNEKIASIDTVTNMLKKAGIRI
jgi:hypothetical protein